MDTVANGHQGITAHNTTQANLPHAGLCLLPPFFEKLGA